MQTQEAVISGKTVTHPTDPMCWDDTPDDTCSMEYRPPSAMKLNCTWQRGIFELTKASCVVGAAFWLIKFIVLPFLASPWNRLGLVGLLAGLLIMTLAKSLLPLRNKTTAASKPSISVSAASALAVVTIALVLVSKTSRLAGVMAYCVAGVVMLGMLARQVVQHQVGWHTANPSVSDERRTQWRSGSEHLGGALKSDSIDLQNLAIEGIGGYFVVLVGLTLHPACYFFCESLGVSTWSWWVPLMTLLTLVGFDWIWVTHSQSSRIFTSAIGHWFHYQRDVPSSPLVFQSPAGNAGNRMLLTWATVGVFVVGMAAMLSNGEYLAHMDSTLALSNQDRAIVSALDTAIVSLTAPWLVWLGLRIIVTPTLVAAWALHEFKSPVPQANKSQEKETSA